MVSALEHVHALAALLAAGGVVLVLIIAYLTSRTRKGTISNQSETGRARTATRPCCYCTSRSARLLNEAIRVESDELVETRCFVCDRCGLPQWHVTRTRVAGPTSR